MILQFIITDDEATNKVIQFKNFIEEYSIDGIEHVEIQRSVNANNQLGIGDILNSITILIKATTKPLTELSKALRDYIASFKTSLVIILPDKTKIEIGKGKYLSADDLVRIIEAAKK